MAEHRRLDSREKLISPFAGFYGMPYSKPRADEFIPFIEAADDWPGGIDHWLIGDGLSDRFVHEQTPHTCGQNDLHQLWRLLDQFQALRLCRLGREWRLLCGL